MQLLEALRVVLEADQSDLLVELLRQNGDECLTTMAVFIKAESTRKLLHTPARELTCDQQQLLQFWLQSPAGLDYLGYRVRALRSPHSASLQPLI